MGKASKERRSSSGDIDPGSRPPHRIVSASMKSGLNAKYALAASASLLTFIIYLSTLHHEFVNWDDSQYVYENLHIRSFDLNLFRWAFFDFYAANWHPLTWISHAVDYAIWGLNPMGHHLTNNVLHAVNTFLVVLLVVRLLEVVHDSSASADPPVAGDSRFALIAAGVTGLLFGLHPLHVESVAWVAERKDLLCALFYLLSIMAYTGYVGRGNPLWPPKEGQPQGVAPTRTYILALFFFILALLSKPMAVSLPLVLLILDWYPFNRIQSFKTLLTAFIEKLPFIALSLVFSILTIIAQKTGGATELMAAEPLSTRLLVAANSLAAYLWKMILPLNLVPLYPYPKNVFLLSPQYFLLIALVAGITLSCLLAVRKQRLWLSCWAYYVITLVPVLGIVQVGYQSMADRYTYLPSLGPFLLAGLSAAWFFGTGDASKKRGLIFNLFAATAAVLVIASMSRVTLRQIGVWKNSIALWTYVIDTEPSSPAAAYNNRGYAFNNIGQFDKAIEDYSEAIARDPSYAMAYRNRGAAFSNMGRLDRAIEDYSKAIAMEPSAAAYYERGLAFERKGQTERASEDYKQAIALKPSHVSAYVSLGVLYGKAGMIGKAIEQFDKVIDISPNNSLAYNNRGFAYSLLGQYDKALKDLDKAIELNSGFAGVYGDRGNVYLKIGQKEFAVRDFRKACDLGDKEGCVALRALLP